MIRRGYLAAIFFVLAIACSREPEPLDSLFIASVSVPDSIDQTGDFSGFEFFIYNRENLGDATDTLLWAFTDTAGTLERTIQVDQTGIYPVRISRNGRALASVGLIIAENDTIRFSAQFPDINNTLEVESREQSAMDKFDRIEANYNRVAAYIQMGQVPMEDIPAELQKWADLFWEVFKGDSGTLAAKFALESALNLLNSLDKPQMFDRLQDSFEDEYAFGLAATLGKEYIASINGLDATVSYLDSVKTLTENKEIQRLMDQSVIKLYLDSLEVEASKQLLTRYEKSYENEDDYSFWYKDIRFDLYELTPGSPAPDFHFITTEGDTVTNEIVNGSPVILEFTTMANTLYQEQYDESTIIYQLFEPQDLQYYTFPFDESPVTIVSFFDERNRFWSLADPPSFNGKEILEDFNIQYFPTRVLIDAEGNIYRKYVGEEFDGIIPAINETFNLRN
ncbi:MAG: hypothetical protein MI700_12120 [Balneolales bacterium]|nr:hypothetical protein [Balneolales bacterium]